MLRSRFFPCQVLWKFIPEKVTGGSNAQRSVQHVATTEMFSLPAPLVILFGCFSLEATTLHWPASVGKLPSSHFQTYNCEKLFLLAILSIISKNCYTIKGLLVLPGHTKMTDHISFLYSLFVLLHEVSKPLFSRSYSRSGFLWCHAK